MLGSDSPSANLAAIYARGYPVALLAKMKVVLWFEM